MIYVMVWNNINSIYYYRLYRFPFILIVSIFVCTVHNAQKYNLNLSKPELGNYIYITKLFINPLIVEFMIVSFSRMVLICIK